MIQESGNNSADMLRVVQIGKWLFIVEALEMGELKEAD